MIRPVVYLAAGALFGGYVVHRLNRTTRAWTPVGIAERVEGRVADYRVGLREFGEDVQEAMAEHEAQLRREHGG